MVSRPLSIGASGMSATIIIFIDGAPCETPAGISVAAALIAQADIHVFRRTAKRQEPRGVFCGMGVCYDCLVTIDGRPDVRACMTSVVEGMRIATS
jgi:predicted molibdopterin-dependent oxidoreductase YjgC